MSGPSQDHSNLPCYRLHHYFDKVEVCDRYRDPSNEDNLWEACPHSPCPNRNTRVPRTSLASVWHEDTDPSQIPRITRQRISNPDRSVTPRRPNSQSDRQSEQSAGPSTQQPATPAINPAITSTTSSTFQRKMSSEIFKAFNEVPKLNSDGSNYAIWSERAMITAEGCGVGDYLTQAAPATKEQERNALRAALMLKVPDSIFMTLKSKKEPSEIMKDLRARFGASTAITEANALERLYTLKCTDGKKIQSHLDDLIGIKDKLAEANVVVSDQNFSSAIISSIPNSYKGIVTAYENSIRIHNQSAAVPKAISPTELITILRTEAQSRASSDFISKPKKEEVAASTTPSPRGRGRNRQNSDKDGQHSDQSQTSSGLRCFNCGGRGHKSNVCPTEKKAKFDQSANSATETKLDVNSESSGDAAISATIDEIDEGWAAISCSNPDADERISPAAATALAQLRQSPDAHVTVDIYDSGATSHMTSLFHRLENYREIPIRSIRAANSEAFQAVGMGDLRVLAPNGRNFTRYLLKNVLYTPAMSATLISLGRLDDKGLCLTMFRGKLRITRGLNGESIAEIPKLNGLYRVHHTEAAHVTTTTPAISLLDSYRMKQETERKLPVIDTSQDNEVAAYAHWNEVPVPSTTWGSAHQHAVNLFNRTARSAVNYKTPYETCYGTVAANVTSRTATTERDTVFPSRETPLVEGEYDQFVDQPMDQTPTIDTEWILASAENPYFENPNSEILDRYMPFALSFATYDPFPKGRHTKTLENFAFMRNKPYRQARKTLIFADNPAAIHWNGIKHVYAYLKGTRDLRLTLGDTEDITLTGYSDSDDDRRAISGYPFLFSDAVPWSSKKQNIALLSAAAAEFVAFTHATTETVWLRNFPIEVLKHLSRPCSFTSIPSASTEDLTADTLTKALPSIKAKHFASSNGLFKA